MSGNWADTVSSVSWLGWPQEAVWCDAAPRPPSWPVMKGGFGALDGCSSHVWASPLRSGTAAVMGALVTRDRCSQEEPAASSLPPSIAGGPVGGSVNINKPYVTFITFSLGFHGDGVGEEAQAFCFS